MIALTVMMMMLSLSLPDARLWIMGPVFAAIETHTELKTFINYHHKK